MRCTDGSVSIAMPMSGTSSSSRHIAQRSGRLCDPGLTAAQMKPIELPIMELWYQSQPSQAYLPTHHLLGALPDRTLSTPRFILVYKILFIVHFKLIQLNLFNLMNKKNKNKILI
jgi:hypothetical protein